MSFYLKPMCFFKFFFREFCILSAYVSTMMETKVLKKTLLQQSKDICLNQKVEINDCGRMQYFDRWSEKDLTDFYLEGSFFKIWIPFLTLISQPQWL